MFASKFRNLDSPVSWFQQIKSFVWRRLLTIVSIMTIVTFVFSLRYILEQALNYSLIINLKNNTIAERTEVQEISVQQSVPVNFCKIERCETVSCSSISGYQDSGSIASNYIETTFKDSCSKAESVKLSFNNCVFPAKKLQKNWLKTELSIQELTFQNCYLNDIEDDAFNSSIFVKTKKIILIKNNLTTLRKAMFHNFEALEELAIRENVIKEAELNLLEQVANSLSSLDLYGVVNDREVLRNITGGKELSNLQILSLRGNSISMIDNQLFIGVPQVKSLYLDNSKIEIVLQNTLQPMSLSLLQLTLNNNNISTLPEGLFDPVLTKQNFLTTIQNNSWNCICQLKWLQDLLRSRSNFVSEIPVCTTPQMNAGKSFTIAEFCRQSTSTVISTISKTVQSTEPNFTQINQTTTSNVVTGTISITCEIAYTFLQTTGKRKLLSIDSLHLPARFSDFYASKTSVEKSILVNLPNLNEAVTLLWFNNDDVEGTLCCAKNVKHSYLVRDIDPKAVYTICLLDDNTVASPLNCLATAASSASYSSAWLTNGDKSLVVSLSILSLCLLFLLGGFLSFLLIRKHPSLLRGSKRVMLVKRRNVDAIVLPKGVDIHEKEQIYGNETSFSSKLHEDDYVTPLPPERNLLARSSMMFRMSSQSDRHSYVSDLEPTETQLDSWRLMRLKSELEKQKSDAPPLPPHPCNIVPSLSATIESKDELYHTTTA